MKRLGRMGGSLIKPFSFLFLSLALTALTFSGCAGGREGTNTLTVKVGGTVVRSEKDGTTTPITDALLTLPSTGQETTTDENGKFYFGAVPFPTPGDDGISEQTLEIKTPTSVGTVPLVATAVVKKLVVTITQSKDGIFSVKNVSATANSSNTESNDNDPTVTAPPTGDGDTGDDGGKRKKRKPTPTPTPTPPPGDDDGGDKTSPTPSPTPSGPPPAGEGQSNSSQSDSNCIDRFECGSGNNQGPQGGGTDAQGGGGIGGGTGGTGGKTPGGGNNSGGGNTPPGNSNSGKNQNNNSPGGDESSTGWDGSTAPRR